MKSPSPASPPSSDNIPNKKFTKSNLPQKICGTCNRPFDWRKKWEKVWDEVKYCSDKCRKHKPSSSSSSSSSSSTTTTSSESSSPDSFSNQPKNSNMRSRKGSTSMMLQSIGIMSTILLNNNQINNPIAAIQPVQAAISQNMPISTKELQQVIDDTLIDFDLDIIQRPSNFKRLDESPDSSFYTETRFVEHIDENAVKAMIAFHKLKLTQLLAAKSLRSDYLTNPVAVLQEAGRYLKPGGLLIISFYSFSNRVFIDKAVAGWTGKNDVNHAETIATYIRSCRSNTIHDNGSISDNNDNKLSSQSSSLLMFNDDIKGYNVLQEMKLQSLSSAKDPLYAIVATKR